MYRSIFFSDHCIKQNRFHVAMGLFSNRSQRTSKCGKNISDKFACGSCTTSLFLPHFDVICDLLLNRRMATWNLFVKYDWLHFCPGNPNCNWASMLSGLLARLTTLRKNEIYGSLYTCSEKPHYIK